MNPYDLKKTLQSSQSTEVTGRRTGHFWDLAPFDGGASWIGQWVGESPWEKHAKGDEFIHVLKGEVEIVVITPIGKKSIKVHEGNIFVVPKDHWHKQIARQEVVVLGATPGVTEHFESEPTF